MAKVYLSPSMQHANACCFGDSEKDHCNKVMDIIERHLTRCGVDYKRNKTLTSLSDIAADSNAYNPDLHFALHTNAVGGNKAGTVRGHHVYYYATSDNGKKAAQLLTKNFKSIYNVTGAQHEAIGNNIYTELKKTKAVAVIEETIFHDNKKDAEWYHNNFRKIAEYAARSICEYLNVKYVEEEPENKFETLFKTACAKISAIPEVKELMELVK